MAILWSTAARGSQVIPCVLIAGLPVILIPEGVTLTGWSAGALDAAWWPGSSFAGFSACLKSWLSLAAPITWDEKAEPVQPGSLHLVAHGQRLGHRAPRGRNRRSRHGALRGARLHRRDVDHCGRVDQRNHRERGEHDGLRVERVPVPRARDDGVHLHHRDELRRRHRREPREVRLPIQHHWYVGNANAALANPEVTSGAPEIIGRTATVWLLEVSAAGVVTAGSLRSTA